MASAWTSLAAFALVIALIPLSLWLLKRTQTLRPAHGGPLSLHSSLALGPRERIAIVRAGDRWLVLGITAQAIATLAELDEAPPAAASAPVGLVLPGAFAQVLGGLRRGSSASAPAPGEPR